MDSSKFETALTRAVAIGGLGCFVPFVFLFSWTGFIPGGKWQIYGVLTLAFIAMGLVNKTRELVRKQDTASPTTLTFLKELKLLAIGASFLVGSILAMGTVLIIFMFSKGMY
jgi:hypothetical protein